VVKLQLVSVHYSCYSVLSPLWILLNVSCLNSSERDSWMAGYTTDHRWDSFV